MIPDFVKQDLAALGLSLPTEAMERMSEYLKLLLETNKHVNLTAIREEDAAWRRLIVDSLTPLPYIDLPSGSRVIDIGTGAGLPGMPLAIALPEIHFSLVDSTGKKIAFLRSVVSALKLENVNLYSERAEDLGQAHEHREQYDLAISRAVGPMPLVLEYCMPMLAIGGLMLAMKGPRVVQELEVSSDAMLKLGADGVRTLPAYPESFGNELVLAMVDKVARTPAAYPRVPGTPKREPL